MCSYKRNILNQAILSKDMKIIELIDVDYRLLSIFQRLDIQLPYGDISIDEMCQRCNMSVEDKFYSRFIENECSNSVRA